MLAFYLDSRSGTPSYLQLAQQVRLALSLGRLAIGDQLPSVREVVSALAINPNTVLRAYRELEHEGLLQSRVGHGTFVVAGAGGVDPETLQSYQASLETWVRSALEAGIDREALAALFTDTLTTVERGWTRTA